MRRLVGVVGLVGVVSLLGSASALVVPGDLAEGLVKEAEAWVEIAKQMEEKVLQIEAVESKPMAKRYPEEQKNLVGWKEELGSIENKAALRSDVISRP